MRIAVWWCAWVSLDHSSQVCSHRWADTAQSSLCVMRLLGHGLLCPSSTILVLEGRKAPSAFSAVLAHIDVNIECQMTGADQPVP